MISFFLLLAFVLCLHCFFFNKINYYKISGVIDAKKQHRTWISSEYNCDGWEVLTGASFIFICLMLIMLIKIINFYFGMYWIAFVIGYVSFNFILYIINFDSIIEENKNKCISTEKFKNMNIIYFFMYILLGFIYEINNKIKVKINLPNRFLKKYNEHMKEISEYEKNNY